MLSRMGFMKRLNSLFCASAYAVLENEETGALPLADDDAPQDSPAHSAPLPDGYAAVAPANLP